jgi:NAD(P)-dependent dehydrogenase (short-subunit alcohol dehydrogenase family)
MDLGGHFKEIDINAKGVVNGLHAAFPYLRDTPNSVAVNLSSASAIYGQSELANYSATKFFVRGITEALDIEWNSYGIRVIAMWPLYVQTAMTANIKTGTTDSLGIRLTAQDVADAIAKAVEPSRLRRAIHQVHFPVGAQTKTLAAGSRFSPAWLTRVVNKRLAHS